MPTETLGSVPIRVGIITPSLNQLNFLLRTADSVRKQTGDFDLVWHIADAGSTDGTVQWVQSLNDPRVHLVSEPDEGQANALNKLQGRADLDGCDIIGWLNSDDLYTPGALAAVLEAFASEPVAQWLIGQCDIIDENDRPIRSGITRYKNRGLAKYSFNRLLRENFVSQPAVFWRRAFAQRVGPFDESLHWTMDYDRWLKMAKLSEPIILPWVLARFRMHAGSKSGALNRAQFDEGYAVAKRASPGSSFDLALHRMHVEKIVWSYRAMRLIGHR